MSSFHLLHYNISASEIPEPPSVGGLVGHVMPSQDLTSTVTSGSLRASAVAHPFHTVVFFISFVRVSSLCQSPCELLGVPRCMWHGLGHKQLLVHSPAPDSEVLTLANCGLRQVLSSLAGISSSHVAKSGV